MNQLAYIKALRTRIRFLASSSYFFEISHKQDFRHISLRAQLYDADTPFSVYPIGLNSFQAIFEAFPRNASVQQFGILSTWLPCVVLPSNEGRENT